MKKHIILTSALLMLIINLKAQVEITSTGTSSAYAVAVPGAFTLRPGLQVTFKAHIACSASATINVSGSGSIAIMKEGGSSPIVGSDIKANQVVTVVYDGNFWQMTTPIGTPPTPSNDWTTSGNGGTFDGTNFIGTTDNIPLNFRVNNQKAGKIDPSNYNTFFGYWAGRDNTTGTSNVANGFDAFRNNTTGYQNTAIGFQSLTFNTTGNYNTALGYSALVSNSTASMNTAIGVNALYSQSFANGGTPWESDNLAIGYNALYYNNPTSTLNGNSNTAVGNFALRNNTTGNNNTANGYNSLYSNTTGNNNTAYGMYSLYSTTIGGFNTGVGYQALFLNTGGFNTGVGYQALYSNTSGGANTTLGYGAGYSFNGNNNTFIGYNTGANATGYSNSTALGYTATVSASNMVRIGNASVTSIGGYVVWTNISDGRFKKDIKENVSGLDFILKLRPVTYHLDMNAIAQFNNTPDSLRDKESEAVKGNMLQTGFIAQEVEKAAKELGYDFSGVDKPKNATDSYGLRYSEFVVPLVKAVQEQQKLIEELKKEIEALKNK